MTSKDSKVANQILRYLQAQPQASDTLRGIAKWWFQNQQLSESIEVVQQALERLREDGVVEQRKTRDGGIIYSAKEPDEE